MAIICLLTACKVKIVVPEGGYVEGFTLHGCGEGQICTIQVDHSNFLDLFTAIPNDTHFFAGWKKGEGYLCGGTTDSCEFNTFPFADPDFEDWLNNDELMLYLEPQFKPKYAGYKNQIHPKLSVKVAISQANYPIDGTDFSTWYEGSQSEINPIEERHESGEKYLGLATWRSDRSRYYYLYRDGTCSMTEYTKQYYIKTTLPAPYFPYGYTSAEAEEYYWDIVLHEGAHNRIARWMIDRRSQEISDLFIPSRVAGVYNLDSCGKYLYDELVRINSRSYQLWELESDEFHSLDLGAYWGKCEYSNRFMTTYCPEEMQ